MRASLERAHGLPSYIHPSLLACLPSDTVALANPPNTRRPHIRFICQDPDQQESLFIEVRSAHLTATSAPLVLVFWSHDTRKMVNQRGGKLPVVTHKLMQTLRGGFRSITTSVVEIAIIKAELVL